METPGSRPAAIARFWAWVTAHRDALMPRVAASDPSAVAQTPPTAHVVAGLDPAFLAVFQEATTELKRVHPSLALEVQGPDGAAPGQLVVTCGGDRGALPAVHTVCAAAPALPGWEVIAFRQPKPYPFELEVGGRTLAPDTVRALPGRARAGRLDLTLYLPGYRSTPAQAFEQAAFLLLDHTLGEYAVMTRIGALTFRASGPTTPRTALPLTRLPATVDRLVPAPRPM